MCTYTCIANACVYLNCSCIQHQKSFRLLRHRLKVTNGIIALHVATNTIWLRRLPIKMWIFPTYCYCKYHNKQTIQTHATVRGQMFYLLGMREELVEGVLVVVQTGHGHQETLDDLPGLASVVRLRVGALQTVQSRLYRLERNIQDKPFYYSEATSSHVAKCQKIHMIHRGIKLRFTAIYLIHLKEVTQGAIWPSKGHYDFHIMA